jgi:uroporphyrinogen decarboxylase
MPFGTTEDVRQKVHEVINILGSDGGFLIAPSHILEPEVPWENVITFVETVKNSVKK